MASRIQMWVKLPTQSHPHIFTVTSLRMPARIHSVLCGPVILAAPARPKAGWTALAADLQHSWYRWTAFLSLPRWEERPGKGERMRLPARLLSESKPNYPFQGYY